MTRILGPPGVGIVAGARVAFRDESTPWRVVRCDGNSHAWALPESGLFFPPIAVAVEDLALDLTEGPLDHGARALWGLVYPSASPPLTAPSWSQHKMYIEPWTLHTPDSDTGFDAGEYAQFSSRQERVTCPFFVVPGISNEPDPRRALALALEAMCARS